MNEEKYEFTCYCGHIWISDNPGDGDEFEQGLVCPKCGGDNIAGVEVE